MAVASVEIDRLPISRLQVLGLLTARTCNTLRLAGITDFDTLRSMSDEELLLVHDLGQTRLAEIRLAAQLFEEADEEAVIGILGRSEPGPGNRFSDRDQASLVRDKISLPLPTPSRGRLTLEQLRDAGLLSSRICNAFLRRGITELAAIDAMSDGDLLSMTGVGPRTVGQIRALAAAYDPDTQRAAD
jgi:DNA-directed RNA polymerase alpha subunit